MKTGTLNKNQGNNHDWTLKIGQKSTPVNWENIPLDWHGAEVTFTRNHNGAIDSLTHNGMIVHHPTLFTAPKASIRSEIKATQGKDDFRERDNRKSNRNSYTHQKPRTNQPNTRNQSHTPYNFVPLNDVVVSAHSPISDRSTFGGHSGYIVFDVESLTHLFIKGKDYDFFKIGSKNAIPGSSLRGMIRSLVEMVSFGKFERYNKIDVYERLQNKNPTLGFLVYENDKYFIYRGADTHYEYIHDRSSEYKYVMDHTNDYITIFTKIIGDSKHLKVKYERTSESYELKDDALKMYKFDKERSAYKRDKGEKIGDTIDVLNFAIKDNHLKIRLGNDYIGIPVWFQLSNKQITSFGHCRNYRKGYKDAIRLGVPKNLSENSIIDFASSIFGFSKKEKDENGNEKTEMYAGKVFFEDVTTESKDTQDAILQILAAPKPKSGKLYLEPNGSDPGRWSDNPKIRGYKLYHHRNTDNHKIEDDVVGESEEQINWQKTRFREREEYRKFGRITDNSWQTGKIGYGKKNQDGTYNSFHVFTKKISDLSDDSAKINIYNACKSEDNNMQFKTVKALPPQTTFKGARIRFEHLTDEELGALLFVMDLPGDCRHKIGMGKPLGMGSIHLINIKLTLIDRKLRYQSLFIDSNSAWNTGESDPELKTHKDKFVSYVNDKINHKGEDLWQHSRMKELRALLRYDKDSIKQNEYLKETNYMHLKEFANTNRGNLPKASVVKNKFFNK